jgi:hypothetical protein
MTAFTSLEREGLSAARFGGARAESLNEKTTAGITHRKIFERRKWMDKELVSE